MVVVGGLATVIVGVAFTIFVLLFILMPIIALHVHLVTTVEYENNYNNAQLGLLVLLSSTEKVGNKDVPISEKIAENIDKPQNLVSLKPKLEKLFGCYKLKTETCDEQKGTILLKSDNCNAKNYCASSIVVQPYGQYSKVISLVID